MLHDCTLQEVLEDIGPYIRDCLRRDAGFRDRLWIFISFVPPFNHMPLHASVVRIGHRDLDQRLQYGPHIGALSWGSPDQ